MTHDAGISNRLTTQDEAPAGCNQPIAFVKQHAQAPGPLEDDDVVDLDEDDAVDEDDVLDEEDEDEDDDDEDEDDEDVDETDAEPELE